jgi:hypothetical protein
MITSYLGTATRSWNVALQGPRDVTGQFTYYPNDMRLVFWGIGSTKSVSGTNSTHSVSEIDSNVRQSPFVSGTLNPPMSFTIEDSQQTVGTGQNFVRTVKGATPDVIKITNIQGDKVNVDVNYVGQTLVYTSGLTTAVTIPTTVPYLWNNVTLTLAGSSLDTTKEIIFEINNNVTPPHYLNGSRDISVPYKGNRDYTLDLTVDLDANLTDMLYRGFYKGGSSFNVTYDLNADTTTGSQHTIFYMSGCVITKMDSPSKLDGVTESKITIRPKNVTGSEFASLALTSGLYGPY